jgi:hypothetical protein
MRLARVSAGVGLLAIVTLLAAQEKDKKGPEPAKAVAKGVPSHWAKLDLTSAQREELAKLYAEYLPKREKLRQEMYKLDAELARKRVAVLNDEQRKKLVDLVPPDPPNENPAEKGKAGPSEKEKPKGKDPDK